MTGIRVTKKAHLGRGRNGRHSLNGGEGPPDAPRGRIPRVTRLMALAIRFEQLIRDGLVRDQAELARLGNVSRARVSQIMNLLNLAPDIQDAILFLPRVAYGPDLISERQIRPFTSLTDWRKQRRRWAVLYK